MAKPKKVTLLERKLGRENAHGILHWIEGSDNPLIEIDERLKGRDRLTVLVHECLHLANYETSEREVIRVAKLVSAVLWADDYRRAEK